MVVDERINSRLGEGAYGTVFAFGPSVVKVFKRFPQFPPRQTEAGRRLVFEAQCKAYEIACADPILNRHVPYFAGARLVEDIVTLDGRGVGANYLLDCAYMMERMQGPQEEWAAIRRTAGFEHLQPIAERFRECGVDAADGSVFNASDPERFQIIDFEEVRVHFQRLHAECLAETAEA